MDHGVDKMKATILLVEDELEIGNLVELYLKNEGFIFRTYNINKSDFY